MMFMTELAARKITMIANQIFLTQTSNHVVVGPVGWAEPIDGMTLWFFTVAHGDQNGCCKWLGLNCGTEECGDECRAAFISAITRPPLVIHDCDEEMMMAKWCESIWPSEETREMRAAVEAPNQSRAH
jgi:hypothetical protein